MPDQRLDVVAHLLHTFDGNPATPDPDRDREAYRNRAQMILDRLDLMAAESGETVIAVRIGEQLPFNEPMDDEPICGRLLVGQGDDTYDPLCVLKPGHDGACKPGDD